MKAQIDMFAVMKELVRQKYPRTLYPEHPRASTRIGNGPDSIRIIRAEAVTPALPTTWDMRGPCCRRPRRNATPIRSGGELRSEP